MVSDVSKLQIFNIALGFIGTRVVNSVDEKSPEAIQCNLYWDRARRSVLRDYPYDFAIRRYQPESMTVPATYQGWSHCYQAPLNALKVWSVHNPGDYVTRQPFEVAYLDDNIIILCNVANAQITCAVDVTNLALWSEQFVTAMARKLALLISNALLKNNPQKIQELNALYEAALPERWQEENWAVIGNSTQLNIYNRALGMIDAKMVSSLTENSPEAVQCNLHFDNARRAVLRDYPFDFAIRKVALEETTMPTITRGDWLKAYLVPADSLRVLSVFAPNDRTTRQPFTVQYRPSYQAVPQPPANKEPTVESFSHALTRGENAVHVTGNALEGSTLGDGTAEEHNFAWGDDTSEFGTMTKNLNGTYNYVIDNNNPRVRALVVGKNLIERFGYTYTDKDGDTANGSVDVEIDGIGEEVEYDFIFDVDTRLAYTEDDIPDTWVFQENKQSAMPFVMDKSYPGIVLRVDWGDGYVAEYTNDTYVTNHSLHTYKTPGEYTIKVKCNNWEAIRTRYFSYGPLNTNEPNLRLGNMTNEGAVPWYFKATITAIRSAIPVTQFEYYAGGKWYQYAASENPRAFFDYSNLKYVTGDLLDNYRDATRVNGLFQYTKLEEIPSNIFREMSELKELRWIFYNCDITSIPDTLLNDCINLEDLYNAFTWTHITSIPENLFSTCQKMINFENCFMATDITSIPINLFAPCVNAENFSYTFADCDQLTRIDDIFVTNTKAKYFTNTFGGLTNPPLELPIPANIFNHSTDIISIGPWFGSAKLEWDKTGDPPVVDFYISSPNVTGITTTGSGLLLSIPSGARTWVEDEEESAKIEGKYYRYVGPVVRVHIPAGSKTENSFRMSGFKDEDYEKVSSPGQWIPDDIYAGHPYILVLE